MRFRGFDPRTRPLRWGLFLLAVAAVLVVSGPGALTAATSWLAADQGRLAWYTTRLSGFLAYGALSLSVLYGLLLSTGILDTHAHRAVSFALHQELAAFGIAFTLVHGAALTLDSTMPYSLVQLLVPGTGPYRPVWVGIGQLSLFLAVAVYASFSLRRRIGQRRWRLLHYATFVAWLGATLHGLMTGTDTSAPWAYWSYVATSAAVVFLFVFRTAAALAARLGQRAAKRAEESARKGARAPAPFEGA